MKQIAPPVNAMFAPDDAPAPWAPPYLLTFEDADCGVFFSRILEPLSQATAIWEVEFTYQGRPCKGKVGASYSRPSYDHEDDIADCEADF